MILGEFSRGAVCTKTLSCPPGSLECDSYETVYCDEPPPPCDD